MRRRRRRGSPRGGVRRETPGRGGGRMLRRLVLATSIVATAALAVIASASGGQPQPIAISWVMAGPTSTPPAADETLTGCAAVTGSNWLLGNGTVTFSDATGNAGNFQSNAHGTAVDNTGAKYQWNYHQSA